MRLLGIAACLLLTGCPVVGVAMAVGYGVRGSSGLDKDFHRSKYTGLMQVVDEEDLLHEIAGRQLRCAPDQVDVFPWEVADVPPGWAASVRGCGKSAAYKIRGLASWTRE